MKKLIPALLLGSLMVGFKPAPIRPNVILILVDDMGWPDVGCYGNEVHQTPNIDRMAAAGVRYTNAYAASAVCSPSRAALVTGKHPARLKITDWIPGYHYPNARLLSGKMRHEMPTTETTLAEMLQQAGYRTMHLGKWHLGEVDGPLKHGFSISVGDNLRGQPGSYFYPYSNKNGDPKFDARNLSPGKAGDYLTDKLTDEAIRLIGQSVTDDKPFFLNFWHYAVHTPLEGKAPYVETYNGKISQSNHPNYKPVYAAMIQSLDESVGRIRHEIDRLGIANNTIIVFMSDNGGLVEVDGNAPLREGKGFYYEGGIRIPWLVEYPGHLKAGTTNETTISHIDFLPTIVELLGLSVPAGLDGQSHAKNLVTGETLRNQPYFWHYPHYHNPKRPPTGAILVGDYKLIRFYEDNRLELYNVRKDPYEIKNLAEAQADITRRLNKQLSDWLTRTKAEMPAPNPAYDPNKPFAQHSMDWAGTNRLN